MSTSSTRALRTANTLMATLALSLVIAGGANAQASTSSTAQQPAAKHQLKTKGAAVGAGTGAAVGGPAGAVAGAAVGAEVQHRKNKKARHQTARASH
jgi:hypothetical protein